MTRSENGSMLLAMEVHSPPSKKNSRFKGRITTASNIKGHRIRSMWKYWNRIKSDRVILP